MMNTHAIDNTGGTSISFVTSDPVDDNIDDDDDGTDGIKT